MHSAAGSFWNPVIDGRINPPVDDNVKSQCAHTHKQLTVLFKVSEAGRHRGENELTLRGGCIGATGKFTPLAREHYPG